MRLILAALFVYAAGIGTIGLLGAHFGDQAWPWWAKLLAPAALLAALPMALVGLNRSGFRPGFRRKTLEGGIAELEAKGKLVRQRFDATRAFAVDQIEDEGPHYYIELVDGRMLYLNGQYLYDYESIDDDPELNQERLFPNTAFEVLRHRDTGYVIHIACSGLVLEPELTAPSFNREELRRGVPEDGQIITDETYDVLKRRLAVQRGIP
jgi:hypothetical protein